jgi:hypothetical protein
MLLSREDPEGLLSLLLVGKEPTWPCTLQAAFLLEEVTELMGHWEC